MYEYIYIKTCDEALYSKILDNDDSEKITDSIADW